jgi:hypothetical protein
MAEDTANFPFARGGALTGFPAGPPLLERDKVTIEGLAFIGLSLSRNHPEQPFAHPASGTFGQTLPHISHSCVWASPDSEMLTAKNLCGAQPTNGDQQACKHSQRVRQTAQCLSRHHCLTTLLITSQ